MLKTYLLAVIIALLGMASSAMAIDDDKIRQKQPPEPRSQEEADICAAILFDAYGKTKQPSYETLSTLWLMAAANGMGVDVKNYKGLIRNGLKLNSYGDDVANFYLNYCIEASSRLIDPKTYVLKPSRAANASAS